VTIRIKNACEHNLHHVDVEVGDGLTVVTGVSGSGKTSLVFDTIYHEARRRFLETYTLGAASMRLSPAKVESITGLGPAIAVGQNLLNRNPGSTLATAVGLHPFLRLLYANSGEQYCAHCGAAITTHSDDEIVERLMQLSAHNTVLVCAALVRRAYGSHTTLLQYLAEAHGRTALHVDGQVWQGNALAPDRAHDIDVQIANLSHANTTDARRVLNDAQAMGAQHLVVTSAQELVKLTYTTLCAECGEWFTPINQTYFHRACPHCEGTGCMRCDLTGLHPDAARVRWNNLRLTDLLKHTVSQLSNLFRQSIATTSTQRLYTEITRRLEALEQVGLDYMTLDRPAPTHSRGEAQRVRLAVALTSQLEDMLHVLDEPTIGLHPANVQRLMPALAKLPGPVIYVEHDRIAAAHADAVIDIGPGAGQAGGRVVYEGTPKGLWVASTPTALHFSLRNQVQLPPHRLPPTTFLTVRGANLRNLKTIDVPLPLGCLTVISGVSGSGKSTLVKDVLVASLQAEQPVGCTELDGPALQPIIVDQSPIGLNPRSNPATYTKLADIVRDCFAAMTGLSASHFSFNRPEGACASCTGMGAIEVRLRFLPSTWIPCPECAGKRFSDEVLDRRASFGARQLSIADFYELPISEAKEILLDDGQLKDTNHRAARQILTALCDVGLQYLTLGQPSPTLSGGEAQRVKLAKYLGRRTLLQHLLVLDEPSTGLHPHDVTGLLTILDRLVRHGASVVVVEHNTDIIRAADWVIDLGPGAGGAGGQLIFAGTPAHLLDCADSQTAQALRMEQHLRPRQRARRSPRRAPQISIRQARANNLKNVSVDIPKGKLTVVTGVSGSGKSSLVHDVLEAEAGRRFLESLSMYERQGTKEGPEAPVESVNGLGVAITVGSDRHITDRRAVVGGATEILHHLGALLATIGERKCLNCGAQMQRKLEWHCEQCGAVAALAEPRHFATSTYAAACLRCHGVGTVQTPNPAKLIIHPEKPLIDAMYSPGFFPRGYLCKPFNGGYDMVQAMAARYGFDPLLTPWNEMTAEAQQAFLFGDQRPLLVTFRSRKGRVHERETTFPGFYGWVRDWDTTGTYTDTTPCPECGGSRLRAEYLAVTLAGHSIHALSEMTLVELERALIPLVAQTSPPGAGSSLRTIRMRLSFLRQVGLGYLHLNRSTATLSAGEAQRIKLAGLLGSGLTSLTVLLDEPSRGLHQSEVDALLHVLYQLRDGDGANDVRNTLVLVEHDPQIIRAADYLIDCGPNAGINGGEIVAAGTPRAVRKADTLTMAWLRGERQVELRLPRREPSAWMTISGARENNLQNITVRLPLGVLTGICGVSGSGKSTLIVDTLARALAPRKQTTSIAQEVVDPGKHDVIAGAPARVVVIDQSKAGMHSAAAFLGLQQPLRTMFAESDDAKAMGITEEHLSRHCTACNGSGSLRSDMGFLPDVHTPCDVCRGTGFMIEAWDIHVNGVALPDVFGLTIDECFTLFGGVETLERPLAMAREVGLGYLVLRQPGYALSSGEAQRLKIANELCRMARQPTLYILDEPTVGLHLEDVSRLTTVLHRLVDAGHSVYIIEHHSHLLAACDWLLEMGPGGGPEGGRVVSEGTPETIAQMTTPTAPFLRAVLKNATKS